ncbi:MAG: TolC family protein [Campylobacterales bacterium]|nr:TolC family protein [Campylobacterales bacterium]
MGFRTVTLWVVLISGAFCKVISPLDVYNLALENDKELENYSLSVISAQKEKSSAFGAFFPTLDLEIEELKVDEFPVVIDGKVSEYRDRRRDTTVSVKQPVYKPSLMFDYKEKDNNLEKATIGKEKGYSEIILKVVEKYSEHYFNSYKLNLLQEKIQNYKENIRQANLRRNSGLISEVDYLKALALNSRLYSQYNSAFANFQSSQEDLRKYTGLESFTLQEQSSFKEGVLFLQGLDFWIERLKNNYEYRQTLIDNRDSLQNIERAKRAFYPTLELSYKYKESDIPESAIEHTATLSLKMNILSGWSSKTQLDKTKVDVKISNNKILELENRLKSEIITYYQIATTTMDSLKSYHLVIESKRKTLHATKRAYEMGRKSIVDVLEAENELFDALVEREEMRKTYLQNSGKLLFTTGELDSTFINNYQMITAKAKSGK